MMVGPAGGGGHGLSLDGRGRMCGIFGCCGWWRRRGGSGVGGGGGDVAGIVAESVGGSVCAGDFEREFGGSDGVVDCDRVAIRSLWDNGLCEDVALAGEMIPAVAGAVVSCVIVFAIARAAGGWRKGGRSVDAAACRGGRFGHQWGDFNVAQLLRD